MALRLKTVVKAWEIQSSQEYFAMDETQQRECLYASGVTKLPRKREGKEKLEALLLTKLDERVGAPKLLQL